MAQRGYRTNNPFALRDYSVALSEGYTQRDRERHHIFPDLATGIEYGTRSVLGHINRGRDTPLSLLSVYAPPSENDTKTYAASLARTLGIGVNDKIPRSPETLAATVRAIARYETPQAAKLIPDDAYKAAVAKATGAAAKPEWSAALESVRADAKSLRPAADGEARSAGRGEGDTRSVQQQLKDLGYDVGKIDGIAGPRTKAAVREFQGDAGIRVDGIAGPETKSALNTFTSPPGEIPAQNRTPPDVAPRFGREDAVAQTVPAPTPVERQPDSNMQAAGILGGAALMGSAPATLGLAPEQSAAPRAVTANQMVADNFAPFAAGLAAPVARGGQQVLGPQLPEQPLPIGADSGGTVSPLIEAQPDVGLRTVDPLIAMAFAKARNVPGDDELDPAAGGASPRPGQQGSASGRPTDWTDGIDPEAVGAGGGATAYPYAVYPTTFRDTSRVYAPIGGAGGSGGGSGSPYLQNPSEPIRAPGVNELVASTHDLFEEIAPGVYAPKPYWEEFKWLDDAGNPTVPIDLQPGEWADPPDTGGEAMLTVSPGPDDGAPGGYGAWAFEANTYAPTGQRGGGWYDAFTPTSYEQPYQYYNSGNPMLVGYGYDPYYGYGPAYSYTSDLFFGTTPTYDLSYSSFTDPYASYLYSPDYSTASYLSEPVSYGSSYYNDPISYSTSYDLGGYSYLDDNYYSSTNSAPTYASGWWYNPSTYDAYSAGLDPSFSTTVAQYEAVGNNINASQNLLDGNYYGSYYGTNPVAVTDTNYYAPSTSTYQPYSQVLDLYSPYY